MSSRPSRIARAAKGVLIDTVDAFVDTFNWITSCLASLKGDRQASPRDGYIVVDGIGSGSPVVRFMARLDGKSLAQLQGGDNRKIFQIFGFSSASADTVPHKTANGGIEWRAAGGGSDEINVVTDVSFGVSGGNITATITKQPVKLALNGDPESDPKTVASLTQETIVIGSSYNADGDHIFKNIVKSAYVLNPGTSGTDNVFSTAEHVCS